MAVSSTAWEILQVKGLLGQGLLRQGLR